MADIPLGSDYFLVILFFLSMCAVFELHHIHECHILFFVCCEGFGVTARSTQECRKLEPTDIVCFHQADLGEYLRDEQALI
jgi:hypothetical protein